MIRKVCFFGPKKKRFMQTESVLKTKNRSGPAKNRFSVALIINMAKQHSHEPIRGTMVSLETVQCSQINLILRYNYTLNEHSD